MSITTRAAPRSGPDAMAWIGNGAGHLALGSECALFEDSDDFLLSPDPFGFGFYLVELAQRGVQGIDLVRLIRKRCPAGVIALSDGSEDAFVPALEAGADMVLDRAAPAPHLAAAVAAVRRRLQRQPAPAQALQGWRLLDAEAVLQAPDGTRIPLSESDMVIMGCLATAKDRRTDRRTLVESLWGPGASAMDNALHATVYRLRKRIEQAGQPVVPVHAVARIGYEFRAPLSRG
ncbi:winged helix-turn-helix domain-containing protein [Roseateles violae]|uniref:Winged helix-turn-helix domain-containing protein n=1 Tax=Roseateles violae TaxID=3058042 RepID=A0ABT8DQS9_9BURK|nr:winged helix-turn-helix domain-containing protein [Pelomonas sp. PFR6]MDN3919294.1 winged helix-turn-helix domain-containing protein [Pelomonas sp. PFR6]